MPDRWEDIVAPWKICKAFDACHQATATTLCKVVQPQPQPPGANDMAVACGEDYLVEALHVVQPQETGDDVVAATSAASSAGDMSQPASLQSSASIRNRKHLLGYGDGEQLARRQDACSSDHP